MRSAAPAPATACCGVEAAGVTRHFTIYGTRYTFTDLLAIEEKRAAVAGVYRLERRSAL